ncbi:2812_t:CDS:2 [Rhizophagus irregularis]|nr:2812_t:CDS:2 [Rhizophagus irregularis]
MASSVENSSQFESCVYNKLKSMKLCVSRTRGSYGDNGIDIFAPLKEHILLVQCKNYTTAKVGINEIREFEGANSFEYFNESLLHPLRMDTPLYAI